MLIIRRQTHFQSPRVEQDLAAIEFLRLLDRLRESFLQDVVHWRLQIPDFFLWENPLFADAEYLHFEEQARVSSVERSTHLSLDVQRALPIFSAQVMAALSAHQQQSEAMSLDLRAMKSDTSAIARKVEEGFAKNAEILSSLYTALSRPIVIPELTIPAQLIPGPLQQSPDPASNICAVPVSSLPVSSSSYIQPRVQSGGSFSSSGNATNLPPALTPFRMSRTIATVSDLWREYAVGLSGQPSVRTTYEGASTEWKRNESERRWYQRRKPILQAVEEIAAKRCIPPEQAATLIDQWRVSQSNTSLHYLFKNIKELLADEGHGP